MECELPGHGQVGPNRGLVSCQLYVFGEERLNFLLINILFYNGFDLQKNCYDITESAHRPQT